MIDLLKRHRKWVILFIISSFFISREVFDFGLIEGKSFLELSKLYFFGSLRFIGLTLFYAIAIFLAYGFFLVYVYIVSRVFHAITNIFGESDASKSRMEEFEEIANEFFGNKYSVPIMSIISCFVSGVLYLFDITMLELYDKI